MYRYFVDIVENKELKNLLEEDIYIFKQEVYSELENMNAPENIINLIDDEMIETSMQNNHTPKEFAWAVLQ